MSNQPIPPPDSSRQIAFHQLLVSARKTWLIDALAEALERIDPKELKEQLIAYIPNNVQRLGTDPDIRIEEDFSGTLRKKVAIEIKGGTDKSNAHNRAGEAEKSHQKARKEGFRDFWTLIAKKGLDVDKLRAESPTTTSWFDVAQILGRQGSDWDDFCSRMTEAVGIPLKKKDIRD